MHLIPLESRLRSRGLKVRLLQGALDFWGLRISMAMNPFETLELVWNFVTEREVYVQLIHQRDETPPSHNTLCHAPYLEEGLFPIIKISYVGTRTGKFVDLEGGDRKVLVELTSFLAHEYGHVCSCRARNHSAEYIAVHDKVSKQREQDFESKHLLSGSEKKLYIEEEERAWNIGKAMLRESSTFSDWATFECVQRKSLQTYRDLLEVSGSS